MIDVEVKIFNRVYPSVAPLCAKNKFVSTVISEPPTAFPAASLIEMNNTTVKGLQSSTPIENFSHLMYQLDVYAMSKSKCREVFLAADEAMIAMNFSRISGNYMPDFDNTGIFRYTARYEVNVDRKGNLYRS